MNWIEVSEQSDVENLLDQFGYFHDACLKELHMWTGTYVKDDLAMVVPGELDTNVKILFQRQFKNPSAIELLFESVTAIHIIPSSENYDSIIRDAIILKHEDNYYWANEYDWHHKKELHTGASWIAAKKLKWRDASEWMGQQNRYGNSER